MAIVLAEGELSNCPFCGCGAEVVEDIEHGDLSVNGSVVMHEDIVIGFQACCTNPECCAVIEECSTIVEARNKWNMRQGKGT